MIIYNPNKMIKERIEQAEKILDKIPVKYCFITGSFLYKEKYEDIDVFVISRSKNKLKDIKKIDKKINLIKIDFNDLHSIFYHSSLKFSVSKNILPLKPLKLTISDYWHVINESIPAILNKKNKFKKEIRFAVLYTEYLINNQILDSYELEQKLKQFQSHRAILDYLRKEIPIAINKHIKKSYIKRFFYTQAGYYDLDYKSQKYLYDLSHDVVAYG
ncbi:hypothetical protein ACFL1H_01635 [Nanoarchaeota archaeon]